MGSIFPLEYNKSVSKTKEEKDMHKQKNIWFLLISLIVIGLIASCSGNNSGTPESDNEEASNTIPTPPSLDELDPDDPLTESIKYGEEIFNETNVVLSD